jgi:GT2 family glycosyltransferase
VTGRAPEVSTGTNLIDVAARASTATVTAVVPNHNGAEFIGGCLDALLGQTVPVSVIVVDDASTDRSVPEIEKSHPDVTVVKRSVNGGFGAAANDGVRAATTPLVAVINSDARLGNRWFEIVTAHAAAAGDQWAWGGVLVDPQTSCVDSAGDCYTEAGLAYRGLRGLPLASLPTDPYEVFAVPGAAVVYRRDRFLELGGYDERHFMYLEDIDLACRAHRRGWSSLVDPAAVGEHDTARSGNHERAFYLIGRNGVWCWLRNVPRLHALSFTKASWRQYRQLGAADRRHARAFRRGRITGLATARPALRERRSPREPSWRQHTELALALRPIERNEG